MAESVLGDPMAVIKVDCAEFQHSHEIAKLIGSPPGYLGHRETRPMLSQEALNQYHKDDLKVSFVLFDEIEKGSDALWNLLLGILDKATLTLGDNRRVDFSRAIIILTSNLGASEMEDVLRPKLGFAAREAGMDAKLAEKMSRAGVEAARRKFTPEFINRLDGIVAFNPLGDQELQRILELELVSVRERMVHALHAGSLPLAVTDTAKDFLLREGTDARYGARHLKRAVERHLAAPVANLIATGQVQSGDAVTVDYEAGALVFFKEFEESRRADTAATAA
jgi:ATP-dependent Clp protease ATP-binding subunit ClpA